MDRGIDLVPRLILDPGMLILLILSAAVAAGANFLQIALQQNGDLFGKLILIAAWLALLLISIVVHQCFTAMTVIKGGRLWLGESRVVRLPTDSLSPANLLRLIALNIQIGIITFLLIFLFIIPSLIYYFNRALAPVALLIEDLDVQDSIRKSIKLMTYHPDIAWYSSRTPMMRISGMLFVMWIINLLPGLLTGASTGAFSPGQALAAPTVGHFALVFLSHLVVFSAIALGTLALVGFYFDLRLRCEGLDLQEKTYAAGRRAALGQKR